MNLLLKCMGRKDTTSDTGYLYEWTATQSLPCENMRHSSSGTLCSYSHTMLK